MCLYSSFRRRISPDDIGWIAAHFQNQARTLTGLSPLVKRHVEKLLHSIRFSSEFPDLTRV